MRAAASGFARSERTLNDFLTVQNDRNANQQQTSGCNQLRQVAEIKGPKKRIASGAYSEQRDYEDRDWVTIHC